MLLAQAQAAAAGLQGGEQAALARIAQGNAGTLRVDGPSATAGARTVTAYLTLDPHPALRQGLFAQGVVELDRQPARVVPLSALRVRIESVEDDTERAKMAATERPPIPDPTTIASKRPSTARPLR